MRPENQGLLQDRWPPVAQALAEAELTSVDVLRGALHPTLRVRGIQLESAWDPLAEARLQAQLIPRGSTRAVLYGLAQGSLARQLLRSPELECLRVVLLSRATARASLTFLDHSDWLRDPRVELELARRDQELELPMAVASACLSLADEQAARLRDLISMELARPHVERGRDDFKADREQNLLENRELVQLDSCVSALFKSRPGASISIAAAGPTLADHFDTLRASDETLIAVDAALKPLLEAGIVPDFVVSQDCVRYTMDAFFDVDRAQLKQSALIYFPSSASAPLRSWTGPRYCNRDATPRGAHMLWSSGSVVHPSVDLALKLGADQVVLYGADFSVPRGRSHVSGSAFEIRVPLDPLRPSVEDGHGRQVQSLPNLIGYLRDLERYIAGHPEVRFVNTSREGARIMGSSYREATHVL